MLIPLGILATTSGGLGADYVFIMSASSPYIGAWNWNNGFGTKYANPTVAATATQPVNSIHINSTNTVVYQTSNVTPYIHAYAWDITGFGTKFANPANLPVDGQKVTTSPNGSHVMSGSNGSPKLNVYPWSNGFGTRITLPSAVDTSLHNVVDIETSSGFNYAAMGGAQTVSLEVFPWTGSTFGSRIAPATYPTPNIWGVKWNPTASVLAHTSQYTPYVGAYAFSGGAFGSKFSNPTTLPPDIGNDVKWNLTGTDVLVAHDQAPGVTAYPWSAGFGTKYANASIGMQGSSSLSFNKTGDILFVAQAGTQGVVAYPWSAGFGTKYADPATTMANGYGVATRR